MSDGSTTPDERDTSRAGDAAPGSTRVYRTGEGTRYRALLDRFTDYIK